MVDRVVFIAKLIILPAAYFGAFGAIIFGSFYIAFGRPMTKLGGLGLILVGIAVSGVALWVTFGRPAAWFPPGENTDYDPRR